MTATIDKRIVEMAFENSKFEQGVGTSLNTIDKLKKSLNFKDQEKSFDGISAAAGRVHLGPIADGVNSIANKFSALGIIGITTLVNLTNAALDAGKKIVNALVIDPIKTGLNEYETKLNSVQTILANTQKEGTNLETVTNALDELNSYSDKTIYNFQQMARNVGTFTAAGVKLDTSVQAIKGIANLAAISGSNADQASTAMYQLSQAISTGKVRLMDWNSVVNAGMGGQVFQDAIMETARVHGVAIDQIIAEEGSFRASLQRDWLSADILTETLAKFTGDLSEDQLKMMGYTEDQIKGIIKMGQTASDAATKVKTFSQLFSTLKEAAQSGWAKTWEIIIGNFEEARTFLTDLNNWFGGILQSSADARNELLQGWKDLGGRTKLIEALQNVLNGIVSVINPIKAGFRDIFPAITAKNLLAITEAIRNLTSHLVAGSETGEKIRRVFRGIFSVFDIGRMFVVAIAKEFGRLLGFLSPVSGGFLEIVASIGDFLVKLRDAIKANNIFEKVLRVIGNTILAVAGVIKVGLDALLRAVDRFKLINKTEGFLTSFVEAIKTFFGFFKTLDFSIFDGFVERITARFAPLAKLGDFLKKGLGNASAEASPFVKKLREIASHVKEAISKFVLNILDQISKIDFKNFSFNKFFDGLNGGLLAALLLAITQFVRKGTGIFGSIVDIFKNVSGFAENANGILGSLKTILDGVKGTFVAWQQQIRAGILLKIAGAIAILSVSLIALSMVDSKKLSVALGAITGLFIDLFAAMATYEKVAGGGAVPAMAKGVIGLMGLSVAVLLLSGALVKVSKIETGDLIKGIAAIGALTAMLVTTSVVLSRNAPTVIKGSASLIIFSIALRSMIGPIKALGAMDPASLVTGLAGVAALLTEIGVFMKSMNFKGTSIDDIIAIFILTAAISDLTGVVKQFATMDSGKLLQGLSTMAVILAELMAFSKLSANGGNFIVTAAGMVVLSGAMLIMSKVLTTLSTMSWEELGVALVGLAGTLTVLAVALNLMTTGMAGAAALLVAAGAMVVLVPPLLALGKMDIKAIGLALLAMAGAFTVLGVAGSVLTPILPSLLLLGVAIGLIGAGAMAAGVGLFAVSSALATLAAVGAAGAAALSAILITLSGLAPLVGAAIALGIVAFAKAIKDGVPAIMDAGKAIMLGLLNIFYGAIPDVVNFALTLISKFLDAVDANLPNIIEKGYSILLSFLQGISNNIEDVTIVVVGIIKKFADTLAQELPVLQQAGWNLIIGWIDAMAAAAETNIPRLMDSVNKLGVAIVKGIAQGIMGNLGNTQDAISAVGRAIIDTFKNMLGIQSPSTVFIDLASQIINGLILGFVNKMGEVTAKAAELGRSVIDAVKQKLGDMTAVGRDLVQGLANGIKNYISIAVESAARLASTVLSTIKNVFQERSPSKATDEMGGYLDEGLAGGIKRKTGVVLHSVDTMGKEVLSGFSGIVKQISDSFDMNVDAAPQIRPVLDMTNVWGETEAFERYLASDLTMNVSSAMDQVSKLGSSIPHKAIDPTASKADTLPTASQVNFTQINNSPKELSRIDIYRQTKNQLLQLKQAGGKI